MADNLKASNLKRKMGNRIVLIAIIGALVVIPSYIGIATAFVLYYGDAYISAAAMPAYLLEQYSALLKYWQAAYDYWEATGKPLGQPFPQEPLTMKLLGPPFAGFVSTLVFLYLMRAPLLDFRPFKMIESVHGDAHWASEEEIRRAKLRAKKGMLLGRTGMNNYLICDDFQHILLFAPTGSGKGVGFVIPNLLFWEQSVVCHDIKMENHELCSGYRKKLG